MRAGWRGVIVHVVYFLICTRCGTVLILLQRKHDSSVVHFLICTRCGTVLICTVAGVVAVESHHNRSKQTQGNGMDTDHWQPTNWEVFVDGYRQTIEFELSDEA